MKKIALLVGLLVLSLCSGCSEEIPTEPIPDRWQLPLARDISPSWSDDGSTIAYRHGEADTTKAGISILRLDENFSVVERRWVARAIRFRARYGYGPTAFSVSPDGSRIAFEMDLAIWVVEVDTGEMRRVSPPGVAAKWPDWHPDGDRLAYSRFFIGSAPDSGGIRILNPDTGEDVPLYRKGGFHVFGREPVWHPDGKSIALSMGANGNLSTEIFRVFPDSTDLIRLTHTGWDLFRPRWYLANGEEQIICNRLFGRSVLLPYIVRFDGSPPRRFPEVNFEGPQFDVVFGYDISPDFSRAVVSAADLCDSLRVLWFYELGDPNFLRQVQVTESPYCDPEPGR